MADSRSTDGLTQQPYFRTVHAIDPDPYAGAVGINSLLPRKTLRNFLREPAVTDPPVRVWRDWALVAVMVVAAVLETVLRTDDVVWRPVAFAVCILIAFTLLWRRTHPLAMTTIAFASVNVLTIASAIAVGEPFGLYTTAILLVLPYALFRWGSGRDALIGSAILVAAWIIGISTDPGTLGEAIGGLTVVTLPAVFGLVVRYEGAARARSIEEAKSREREQLARELHDTVAHHVSAIAVQAQAGRALAATRPDDALGVLEVIEDAAIRTMSEMRTMVRALRQDESPRLGPDELLPQQGIADLNRLSRSVPDSLAIEVRVAEAIQHLSPHQLSPSVDSAVFRIAQESVTNVLRHAPNARHVKVEVGMRVEVGVKREVGVKVEVGVKRDANSSDDRVILTVVDDGDRVDVDNVATGYGLLGMAERAKLLGGHLEAGPSPDGGWRVAAEFPLVLAP